MTRPKGSKEHGYGEEQFCMQQLAIMLDKFGIDVSTAAVYSSLKGAWLEHQIKEGLDAIEQRKCT